jgi:hypothetical protein
MKTIARVILLLALLGVGVLVVHAGVTGEIPAQCTTKECAAIEFPLLTETGEILVSGTFICGRGACDPDLTVAGALRIDDVNGANSYDVYLDAAVQSKVSVGMVPFSTTIQLQSLDVDWKGLPGHGTLFLGSTNKRGGSISAAAYVIPSTEPTNLSSFAGYEAQAPGFAFPPYVARLADPRPSPILVLPLQ